MNHDIASASVCYGLYDNGNIIGFCAVLHQPHGKNAKLKRCSRLVILPDYQGIGLGTKFLNVVAEHYKQDEFDFRIVTSAKNMIHALNASSKWKLIRWSVNKCNSKGSKIDGNRKSMRDNCMTGGVPLHLTIASSIRTKCMTASFQYASELVIADENVEHDK